MNHYQFIIKEKSDCEIDLDKVIWIAVPNHIKLALTDPTDSEYELMTTSYDSEVPGTDITATTKTEHSIDVLKYNCYIEHCEHTWIEPLLPQYGACDTDCPICGARHCSPEVVTAYLS